MRFQLPILLLGASSFLLPVAAQTWTNCNPLNTTCPNDLALGTNHTFIFNQSSTVTNTFNITAGSLVYGPQGTEFTIDKTGDSPTIQSEWYIMFGSVSVVMKAATGQGIISSFVLESDDLDEIDWEFMGGNGTHAETNYFGKGNTTSYDRDVYYPVSSDLRENFHNYTVIWTAESLKWQIDGTTVRVLNSSQANGGNSYPQTPCTVRLGIWAGGDPSLPQKTIDWAGGLADFSKGPFTMYVQSADVKDYGSGKEYQYTDRSGSWQSIKAIAGNSTAAKTIYKETHPVLTIPQKWAAMSTGSKIGVYVGAGGGAALLALALLFYFIRQRRTGRKAREAYNAKVEKESQDHFKDQMELKQRGEGGWNETDIKNQGGDALGGWGEAHATPKGDPLGTPGGKDNDSHSIAGSHTTDYWPGRPRSPTYSMSGSAVEPSTLLGHVPFRAHAWQGGNSGGLVNEAGNAHTGKYVASESPTFPFPAQQPPSPIYANGQEQDRGMVDSIHSSPTTGGYHGNAASPQNFPFAASPISPQFNQNRAPSIYSNHSNQSRGLIGAAQTARTGGYSGRFQPRSISDNYGGPASHAAQSQSGRSISGGQQVHQSRSQTSLNNSYHYPPPSLSPQMRSPSSMSNSYNYPSPSMSPPVRSPTSLSNNYNYPSPSQSTKSLLGSPRSPSGQSPLSGQFSGNGASSGGFQRF